MIKRFHILLALLCFYSLVCNAQSISVSSFKLLDTDLTANTAGTMEMDQNGETAALIKVVTSQTGFTFDGGALGIVKTQQTPGEIWVYIPRGSRKISIKHPQLGVLRDYPFPVAIQAARTYEMVLVTGEVQTIVKQTRTSQYVVFQLNPSNAIVELDGELLQTESGAATKMVKFGTYNYRVQAPNYFTDAGVVTVDDPNNKKVVNINLKPNFAKVKIEVDNNAEIWINGEKKGEGSWTGDLGAGMYEFEAKKSGHRSTTITRDIIVEDELQEIRLQTPTPVYGEADISSNPIMADIYIDGKNVGQTPQVLSQLLIGNHEIMIKKSGYDDYISNINIKENESSKLSVKLVEKTATKAVEHQIAPKTEEATRTITVDGVSFNMIKVDAGIFKMGATSENTISYKEEKPVHKVTLSTYYIGETEVTQELWETVMGTNPSDFKGYKRPVENVSWEDCQRFIEILNNKTGMSFSLPTEAEWEFAARGGLKTKFYIYSGSNILDKVGWYDENSGYTTHEVKGKLPNELGIYDMTGNVWEWCQDTMGAYSPEDVVNPTGATKGSRKVIRGGSYSYFQRACRNAYRSSDTPRRSDSNMGLRLALHI